MSNEGDRVEASQEQEEVEVEAGGGGDYSDIEDENNNADAGGEDDDDEDDEDLEDDDEGAMMMGGNGSNHPLAELPSYLIKRVDRLKELNDKREKVMEDYLKDRAALETKYHKLFQPLYTERSKVVQGERDDEIDNGGKLVVLNGDEGNNNNNNNKEAKADDGDGLIISSAKVKGIPQFWVCAMGHREDVGTLITEDDVECLEYLEDITCTDDEDGKGFTLRFFFKPNEYFHDTVLSKRYEVPNLLTGDEPILKNVVGCSIQWKKDKCLTHNSIKKKQRGRGKNAGQVRTVTKKEPKESFFNWFDPPQLPTMDMEDIEDITEVERLEEVFDTDYDVAQSFRLHIIPRAVLCFTGEAAEQELEQAIDED